MIDASTIIKLEKEHYAQVYQKLPVVLERGKGAMVWDVDGKEYVDCMAGYGVALVGHCNPLVVSAVKAQVDLLITCQSSLYNPARSELLEKLPEYLREASTKCFFRTVEPKRTSAPSSSPGNTLAERRLLLSRAASMEKQWERSL